MRLIVDLDNRKFTSGTGFSSNLPTIALKRGDELGVEIRFLSGGVPVLLGAPFDLRLGFRAEGATWGERVALATGFVAPGDASTGYYTSTLDVNTAEASTALAVGTEGELDSVRVYGEVTWSLDSGATWTSTENREARLFNDVNRTDEGTPLSLPTPAEWLTTENEARGIQPVRSGADHLFPKSLTIDGTIVGDAATVVLEPLTFDAFLNGFPSYSVTLADTGTLTLSHGVSDWEMEYDGPANSVAIVYTLGSEVTDPTGLVLSASGRDDVTVTATDGTLAPVLGDRGLIGDAEYFWNDTEWVPSGSEDGAAPVLVVPRFRDAVNTLQAGNTAKQVAVMALGDSMTIQGLFPHFVDRLGIEVGEAGRGFGDFRYIADDPGLVTIPTNLTHRRTDVFGTGITMEFRNGAEVSMGPQFDANFTAPYELDTIKIFYALESGAGEFEVWTSNSGTNTPDDATFPGSWTLRATVDADNGGSLAGGIETISVTEDAYCVKIRVISGTVDVVGALFLNSAKRGVIRLPMGLGGADVDAHWINQDGGVLNTFLGDLDPDLIVTHYSYSDEDDVTEFATFDNQVKAAAPLADRVVIGEHEQSLNDPKIALHEPHILSQVTAESRLEYFPTKRFLNFTLADSLGWTSGDSDAIHQDEAWFFVNTIFMQAMGFDPVSPVGKYALTESTGSLRTYEMAGVDTFKTQVFTIPVAEDQNSQFRYAWTDGNGDAGYWAWVKKATTHILQLFRLTGGSGDEVVSFDGSSRAYFGSESGAITARYDARVRVHEGSGSAATIGASHSSSSGMVWEGWDHNSNSPVLTSSITAGGDAVFQLLNLAAIPTFADDTAAASLAAGDVYKTATGELRVKL